MAQHDYVIANASGATVRADINSALSAIQTLNSGTSEPSSTAAGMLWLDTTGGAPYALKVRDAGNNHWLTLASVTDPGSDGNIETSATIKGTIDSSATFPSGHILQVISHIKSDKQTGNATTFVDLTGTDQNGSGSIFCVKITPSSTSNKILIICNGVLGMSGALNRVFIQLVRDTTALSLGDSATGHEATTATVPRSADSGWIQIPFGINFLDSPSSTSELTYKIQIKSSSSGNYFAINSAYNNDANVGNTATNITIMEVQG